MMELVSLLLKKAKQFVRLATFESEVSQIDVIKNRDPLLKQLSDLKNFDARIEFADKSFPKKLGTGSSRVVYKISDDLIIKVAYNDKGIAQNQVEGSFELQKACALPIIVADPKGKWLITHFSENMTKQDFKRIIGVGFDAFMNGLSYAYNNEADKTKPKDYDEVKDLPLFECLGKMVVDGSLLLGDIGKPSSFGVRNEQVVLRDFGFSKSVWSRFYASDSSSSSVSSSSS